MMLEAVSENVTFETRSACELCGDHRRSVLFTKSFTDPIIWKFLESYYQGRIPKSILVGGKYELVKCNGCEFIWQTQILNDQGMHKLYSEWISSEESLRKKKCADISMYSGYAREVEAIPFLVERHCPAEITVLDYGMGWGYWCLMAKAFGFNVMGLELSIERASFATGNGIKVLGGLKQLTPGSIDFINAEQVFEHIPKPREALDVLVQCLVEGGVIRISVPDGRWVERKATSPSWKPAKDAAHPLEHINIFTHQSLRKLGQFSGLQVIAPPFLLGGRRGLESYIRAFLGKYYRQYGGTLLYFRKIHA
jgi:2-polyprenyl-3-methyl-5-hydroxy-6-metoxy-1,4-benzoquinol methylase